MGNCLKKKDNSKNKEITIFNTLGEEILKKENEIYKEIDQIFHEFDHNNNMHLEAQELNNCLNELIKRKKDNKEIKQRIEDFQSQMILDNSKSFTKEQFRIILSSILLDNITLSEIIELFRIFDKKEDGVICMDEIIHNMKNLGLSIDGNTAKKLIEEASLTGNPHLDFEEFTRMLLS